jgi:hypothetical protein
VILAKVNAQAAQTSHEGVFKNRRPTTKGTNAILSNVSWLGVVLKVSSSVCDGPVGEGVSFDTSSNYEVLPDFVQSPVGEML